MEIKDYHEYVLCPYFIILGYQIYTFLQKTKKLTFFYAHNCVVFMDGLNVVAYLYKINQSQYHVIKRDNMLQKIRNTNDMLHVQ